MELQSDSSERMLCLSCQTPNETYRHFCVKCGAPLSTYAAIGPYEQIMAQGFAYRQAVDGSSKMIVLVGAWIIFLPMALMLPVMMWLRFVNGAPAFEGVHGVIIGLWSLLAIGMLYRVTANFVKKRRIGATHPGATRHPSS